MDGIRVGRWQWPLVEGLGTRRGDKIIKTSKGWYQDIEVLPLWQPKNLFDFAVLLLLPQGIQYLIEQQLLSSDLQEIAKFLHKGEGLNKTAIGDFLGGRWATQPRWGGSLEALSCLAPLSHPFRWPLGDHRQVLRLTVISHCSGLDGQNTLEDVLWSVAKAGCMGYLSFHLYWS